MADAAAEGANAFATGVEAQGALSNQRRQTAAYNVLAATHGPIAGYALINPQAAQAGETIQYAQPTAQANLASAQAEAPLRQAQTAQAQANTTNLTQSNAATAGIRGARMLQAIANPDDSIPQDEAVHVLSNPAYGLDQNQVQALAGHLAQPGGKAKLDDIVTALQAGGKATGSITPYVDENGQTHLIRGTATGGITDTQVGNLKSAPQERVDTANAALAERTRQDAYLRAHGWTETMIQNYRAGTQANNSAFGAAPGTSLPAVNQNGPANSNTLPKPSTDLIGAGNPPGSKTAQPPVPVLTGKALANRSDQAQLVNVADRNFNTASQVIGQLEQQASAYTTGAGSWGDWLRGSQAADLRANAAALRGQVGSAIISNMKNAQGQMGFRMTQAEFKTLTDSLGALGTEQSADQFKQHLKYVKDSLQDFNQNMHAKFQTQWQTSPRAAIGLPDQNGGGNQPAPQDIVNELRRRGVVK